ncbi:hypothetical protein FKM82_017888 [Ascaphus truei]
MPKPGHPSGLVSDDPLESPSSEEQQKKKENTANAKRIILRAAGLLGTAGAGALLYIFGSSSVDEQGNKVRITPGGITLLSAFHVCHKHTAAKWAALSLT